MPTNLLARVDWSFIYPPFYERVFQVVGMLHDGGNDFWATSGYRSPEEQLALWQHGRNEAGAVVDPKSVVTKLKSGPHNLGIACDLVRDADLNLPGLQPDYKAADYEPLATTAEAHGLESGLRWKGFVDADHVQLPLSKYGLQMGALRRIHQIHGLKAVFLELDKYKW